MTASQIIEDLVKLGTLIGSAADHQDGDFKWKAFLASEEYGAIQGAVQKLLARISDNGIDAAIARARSKQAALAHGSADLSEMPIEKLLQYAELGKVIIALSQRRVSVAENENFFDWLLKALPKILEVAVSVAKLLL